MLRGGLGPAIQADDGGPDGPSWPRPLDLMRLAAQRFTAEILASAGPLVLTRLVSLARYDLLSVIDEIGAAHRAPVPAAPSRARQRRICTEKRTARPRRSASAHPLLTILVACPCESGASRPAGVPRARTKRRSP